MGSLFIDLTILVSVFAFQGSGFLLGQGPQCHQCAASFSPHSCSKTVSCLSDQDCYTERHLVGDSVEVYSLGCESKAVCRIVAQSVNGTYCFKCCGDSLCNRDICGKEACDQGYYGSLCAERCGHCGNGQQCDMVTGRCPNGCASGYLPPFCHAACPLPFYGPACSKTCGHCAGDKLCEPVSGICRDDCQPGFSPPYCIEEAHPETPNLRDCKEVRLKNTTNGIYELMNNGSKVTAWCDMVTDNGGWIVFQRRVSDSVTFNRTWIEYRHGFGNMSGNFWWGNDKLSAFTNSNGSYVLRIDMEDAENHRTYARYQNFYVENEQAKFRLHVGEFAGNAGDGLVYPDPAFNINGQRFSTKDQDNDSRPGESCAELYGGSGWWFNNCMAVNLNGRYRTPGTVDSGGIKWSSRAQFSGSLQWVEMKFRPL